MRLNRHFHTFELLRTPPHKPQKSIQKDHETVVWECIQTLGFQDIPKMPLSQAYGV